MQDANIFSTVDGLSRFGVEKYYVNKRVCDVFC